MKSWPVLKSYQGEHLRQIAMPLGGIGTGTVSLGGRGNLQDWAIMNNPAIGFTPMMMEGMRQVGPFFALFTEMEGKKQTLALEGVLDPVDYEAAQGSFAANHGLPKFRQCRFDAAYPLAQVTLQDKKMPVDVKLKAFNPLIPGDSRRSGLPTAVLTYELTNTTDKPVTASVCGTMINHIGQDGRDFHNHWWDEFRIYTGARRNYNEFRSSGKTSGIFMQSKGVPKRNPSWGTMALTTQAEGLISHRTAWAEKTWGGSLLDFWDDFSDNGELSSRTANAPLNQMASLAVKKIIPAGETVRFPFLLSWHFPNRPIWDTFKLKVFNKTRHPTWLNVGNYYTTQFSDAWDAAEKIWPQIDELENDTLRFVETFCSSDLPLAIKESALFNISTLRSQTCFQIKDGTFFGWEGIHDFQGSCFGSCTHVWNYEQTTAYLFGDLARSMRKVEFLSGTDKNGKMKFRVFLPLWLNKIIPHPAAADGQMGSIMQVYREWQLSGDNSFLQELWPKVRKALEFCWLEGGWDADKDGVMEGCQHNTMDVEYYGPNPQMQSWYLGALRAAEEMAEAVGEKDFSRKCRELFEKGKIFMDEQLFNGSYYEHIIQVQEKIRRDLVHDMGAKDLDNPAFQLGAGCLIDQLVGQYMAHVLGLGYLINPDNVKRTLKSIMKNNFKDGFHHHFNHMRSYVLNDEKGILMASYPNGNRPEEPFPYCSEVMTGFEYSTAAHMLYEGLEKEGLKVISAIRSRYDGLKRNPFDEAECGHHYVRAMAAWAGVLAYTGFHFSGVQQEMSFRAVEGKFFWSNGSAWGTCEMGRKKECWEINLSVLSGNLQLSSFKLTDVGHWENPDMKNLLEGTIQFEISV